MLLREIEPLNSSCAVVEPPVAVSVTVSVRVSVAVSEVKIGVKAVGPVKPEATATLASEPAITVSPAKFKVEGAAFNPASAWAAAPTPVENVLTPGPTAVARAAAFNPPAVCWPGVGPCAAPERLPERTVPPALPSNPWPPWAVEPEAETLSSATSLSNLTCARCDVSGVNVPPSLTIAKLPMPAPPTSVGRTTFRAVAPRDCSWILDKTVKSSNACSSSAFDVDVPLGFSLFSAIFCYSTGDGTLEVVPTSQIEHSTL